MQHSKERKEAVLKKMNNTATVISICLCTYRRPFLLEKCLKSLLKQTFTLPTEVVVVDNDSNRSAEKIVQGVKNLFNQEGIVISYMVEPIQNIAHARNRSVRASCGHFVAFIDDDERASPRWLETLYQVLLETGADGVFGPVEPDIPEHFPEWMHNGLFNRSSRANKSVMPSTGMATCNALIKSALLFMRDGPFDIALGKTGGSDSDLFAWLQHRGAKFVWSEEALVFETIEEKRKYLRWHLLRAYRGGWGYSRSIVKKHGISMGFLVSFTRIIPSFLKAFLKGVSNLNQPRYFMFILLSNISTNLGKIGYFFGIKIEEYKG
ncbi:MAG: glycosyltransferase family 2 protein [Syntrophales bacterium]|nr:glycosyltransferase family 2 protein [Syntrophales bacterium]